MRLWLALLVACAAAPAQTTQESAAEAQEAAPAIEGPDPFLPYLEGHLTAGFSSPVSGWASCGAGCWTTRHPGEVRAIADGELLPSEDGAVRLRVAWLEDQQIREITAIYQGIAPSTPRSVSRGEPLGQATRLELRLDGTDEPPADFIAARPSLFVPQQEPRLALISRQAAELRIYDHGQPIGRYPVGFGQVEGDKEVVKDRRTPLGTYFVVQRSRGPFDGAYAAYYGGIWLRLNYPNAYDAARGVDAGYITPEQQKQISQAWRARKATAKDTHLGGGIGVHAWAYPWDLEGDRLLSWGCVVVQPDAADAIYSALPEGTMVILF